MVSGMLRCEGRETPASGGQEARGAGSATSVLRLPVLVDSHRSPAVALGTHGTPRARGRCPVHSDLRPMCSRNHGDAFCTQPSGLGEKASHTPGVVSPWHLESSTWPRWRYRHQGGPTSRFRSRPCVCRPGGEVHDHNATVGSTVTSPWMVPASPSLCKQMMGRPSEVHDFTTLKRRSDQALEN